MENEQYRAFTRFKFISSDITLINKKLDRILSDTIIPQLMKEECALQYKEKPIIRPKIDNIIIKKDFEVDKIEPLFPELNISIEQTDSSVFLKFPVNWNGEVALCSTPINHRGRMQKLIYSVKASYIELSNDGQYKVLSHDFQLLHVTGAREEG
ncbi:hypothetical protein SAMN05421780_103238 [Flexibacter flexilis DSM 6793]|uniref:Uncharacterized protein n=1 Tax=Flexibacter flexilis DSM 6793 TaxID=927664 RepID=A0A1I1H8A1_9BACT|nr:hypothetical protein [Flexibacter flexilis]SFC19822.1 hypothetical protein SAMN05421780_103238 [Flexibacter flexilis DSM 6793]